MVATFAFAVRNVAGERYEDVGAIGGCFPPPPPAPPTRLCVPFAPTAFVYPAATRSYEVGLVLEWRP